jgi:3-methyladenine DNA glycosylase/8-oxoguanine DNA glycosylase
MSQLIPGGPSVLRAVTDLAGRSGDNCAVSDLRDPGAGGRPDVVQVWTAGWPVDLGTTLGPLCRGRFDPTIRLSRGLALRATLTPEGAATVRYRELGAGRIEISGWGPGAAWEVAAGPTVLGCGDDPAGFDWGAHPLMARARRTFGTGWRAPRTGRAWEALAAAVLEQRVTGRESRSAWRVLVGHLGSPAPGPGAQLGLRVVPGGEAWARVPSWTYHRAGVDPARMRTLIGAGERAASIERLGELPPEQARSRLQSLPGIGPWTAAEVAIRAWGDRDAVSYGDFHLARVVAYSLTGRLDGDDAGMAELLAPWSGQRARAVRMIELAGSHPPRRGPRATITDHRSW